MQSPAFARFGMDTFLHTEVLAHETMQGSLSHLIGSKFAANSDSDDYQGGKDSSAVDYVGILRAAMEADPAILEATARATHSARTSYARCATCTI